MTDLGFDGAMVNVRSGERGVDAAEFWDIYEAAAELRVPLYLHPRAPLPAVGRAYYGGSANPWTACWRPARWAGTTTPD